jgi:hypothetical protein
VKQTRVVLSDHAQNECVRRGIPEAAVRRTVRFPEQVLPVRPGREVRQALVRFPPDGAVYLLRAIVDVSPGLVTVVTAYRTSKVEKYWRQP